jgi:hypothetical protein
VLAIRDRKIEKQQEKNYGVKDYPEAYGHEFSVCARVCRLPNTLKNLMPGLKTKARAKVKRQLRLGGHAWELSLHEQHAPE